MRVAAVLLSNPRARGEAFRMARKPQFGSIRQRGSTAGGYGTYRDGQQFRANHLHLRLIH